MSRQRPLRWPCTRFVGAGESESVGPGAVPAGLAVSEYPSRSRCSSQTSHQLARILPCSKIQHGFERQQGLVLSSFDFHRFGRQFRQKKNQSKAHIDHLVISSGTSRSIQGCWIEATEALNPECDVFRYQIHEYLRYTQTCMSISRLNALSRFYFSQDLGGSPEMFAQCYTAHFPLQYAAVSGHVQGSAEQAAGERQTTPLIQDHPCLYGYFPCFRKEQTSLVATLHSAGLAETRPARGIFRVLMHEPFRCPSSSHIYLPEVSTSGLRICCLSRLLLLSPSFPPLGKAIRHPPSAILQNGEQYPPKRPSAQQPSRASPLAGPVQCSDKTRPARH